ncbi:MAG: hypothetical protein CNE98_05700 [Bacteroidetes bacterium MED-G17]|nr:MAG: hypothetical protein CBB99_07325 [Bacteroidetes bacterium TMED39]PDH52235.1 MAG: hypothetical protein CNE98_05700 [Bacteroidetes bacterium MED-G17]CAI8365429.1 MAG: Arabinogalactan biosynthesis recruiting protein [Bacteroidetes bacterium MED-G17]
MYKATKEISKFILSGATAVLVDLIFYYTTSPYVQQNVAKAIGFVMGTIVTYNLNKFWTWRQPEKDNTRIVPFFVLYGFSMLLNVLSNAWALQRLPDYALLANLQKATGENLELFALKIDKISAFLVATIASSVLNFLGQKFWVFKK